MLDLSNEVTQTNYMKLPSNVMIMEGHPIAWIMVGFPCTGKSAMRQRIREAYLGQGMSHALSEISSDDYLEKFAAHLGISYNEAFDAHIDYASQHAEEDFIAAIIDCKDMVIDRTNLNQKSRRRYLSRLGGTYRKVAVIMRPSGEAMQFMYDKRSDKRISDDVMASMRARYQEPTLIEGFDHLHFVNVRLTTSLSSIQD